MIGACWRALGVDPAAHALLHRTFWDLSRRGGSALVAKRGDARKSTMTAVYVTYASLGLLSGLTVLFGGARDAIATQVCGTALVLLAVAVVADFASVVVAPGDDEVLFHLPISSRTYLAARMTVAARHTMQMALAFAAGPSIIAGFTFRDPVFAATLTLAVVLSGWFALLLSFVIYRAALRWFGGERLRTTLAYLPGIISLVASLGPQLLINSSRAPGVPISAWKPLGDWALLFPPAWFAALPSLASGALSGPLVIRGVFALASLPLGLAILLRALGGSFLADLIRLVGAKDGGPVSAKAAMRPLAPGRGARRLLGIDSDEARAGYLLAVGAFRSRESKSRTFPLLLLPIAMVSIGLFRRSAPSVVSPIFGVFFLGASAGSLLAILPFHEHRDAGWIHEALPIRRYGDYYLGVVEALLFRLVGPWMAAVVAIAIVMDPTRPGIGLVLHALTGSMLAVPAYAASEDDPPFSRTFSPGDQKGRVMIYVLNMVGLCVIAGIGLALRTLAPWALPLSAMAFLLVFVVWMRAIRNRLNRHPPDFLRAARWSPSPTSSRP